MNISSTSFTNLEFSNKRLQRNLSSMLTQSSKMSTSRALVIPNNDFCELQVTCQRKMTP